MSFIFFRGINVLALPINANSGEEELGILTDTKIDYSFYQGKNPPHERNPRYTGFRIKSKRRV